MIHSDGSAGWCRGEGSGASRVESSRVESSRVKSSQVKSSQVKSSIAGVVSPQLALVLRRLGERVRVGFDFFWFVLACLVLFCHGKSPDAAIAVVSRDERRDALALALALACQLSQQSAQAQAQAQALGTVVAFRISRFVWFRLVSFGLLAHGHEWTKLELGGSGPFMHDCMEHGAERKVDIGAKQA
jgi:hypothetical protein